MALSDTSSPPHFGFGGAAQEASLTDPVSVAAIVRNSQSRTARPAAQNQKSKTKLIRRAASPAFAQTAYAPVKRFIDVVGASALLLVLAPVMVLCAVLIKLSSPGPVIFRQRRLTRGGRVFTMYKFRTMFADAESTTGAVWAKKHDPRITPIGRVLRTTHLDEVPQLANVLRGEMSLIGPRPERPEFAGRLQKELPSFNRRLEVNAGITGLAQTTNGYASSIESYRRKLAFDRLYVRHRCLWLDLRIAGRTLLVFLTGKSTH